jgi:ABC-2 type transport system ATP-binding protein
MPYLRPSPFETVPLLLARSLTVAYGKFTVLDHFDLIVPPRQVVAILGPNGAGKTTFVRTVATLIRPTSGELLVRGKDVRRDPTAVRRSIGLAGQYAAIEPTMTGRENLEMTARLFGHRSGEARRAVASVLERLSLQEVADRRCSTYSGGQRRRLDLGASLVGAPDLLLLDEPTTGLDPTGREEVWDAVRSLVAGGTDVLLTTHYLEEANELADQVVVIDHGAVIASGPVSQLKAGIGRDVIEVALTTPKNIDRAGDLLKRVTANPVRIDRSRRTLSSAAGGGTSDLAAVIQGLDGAAVAVEEVALRRPTLDEVFFTLTRTGGPASPGVPTHHGESSHR